MLVSRCWVSSTVDPRQPQKEYLKNVLQKPWWLQPPIQVVSARLRGVCEVGRGHVEARARWRASSPPPSPKCPRSEHAQSLTRFGQFWRLLLPACQPGHCYRHSDFLSCGLWSIYNISSSSVGAAPRAAAARARCMCIACIHYSRYLGT
jgi:hypothetical protein